MQSDEELMIAIADGDSLAGETMPGASSGQDPTVEPGGSAPGELTTLEKHEREHVLRVLEATKNNKNLAAKILGITRRSLYRKLEKHGIQP